MSFFTWKKAGTGAGVGGEEEGTDHTGRNLQDGLFQIASQACHILVQVNNTHNVSYGGSNKVTNIAYSKCSSPGNSNAVQTASSALRKTPGPPFPPYNKQNPNKDQDVLVLLPHRKSRTPRLQSKLSTVSENARLDVNSSTAEDDYELWDQTGFMLRHDADDTLNNTKWGAQGWCKPSCIPITIILILIVLVVLLPLLDHTAEKYAMTSKLDQLMCTDNCKIHLVESIPIGLKYNDSELIHESTYKSWMNLINSAQSTIEIASLYWTLRKADINPSDDSAIQGTDVFDSLLKAGVNRRVSLKIVQNMPSQSLPNEDTEILMKKANAEVRSLNFAALLGAGVLHTKLWLIDRKHVYVGSANMDWRALTQVKELGLVAYNCTCLAQDYAKIFDVYWKIGADKKVPPIWPDNLSTNINMDHPMNLTFMNNTYKTFISSSPPSFSPKGRTDDLKSILYCIEQADKFIYISVMDYFPLFIYGPKIKYWSLIDDALRAAAIERKITIKLLISWWKHSRTSESFFLKSLQDLTSSYESVKIEVKRFVVPTTPDLDKIPYIRVNHNKYMVTDAAAYIGTSNWSGDYFTNTAGIGTIFEDTQWNNKNNIRQQLEDIFNRDWNSKYSYPLDSCCETVYPTTSLQNIHLSSR